MTTTEVVPKRVRPPELPALNGLRFLSALQLFLFHILAFHRMPGAPFPFPAFDLMPQPIVRLIDRGYCSTSLFFLLSGFILAYLYLDERGDLVVPRGAFWRARLARLYPLHLLLLPVAALPAIMMAKQMGLGVGSIIVSGLLSAALMQAWSPRFALSWNFPTWALSCVVFFYGVFPWLAPRVMNWSQQARRLALFALPILSLIPSVIYILVRGTGQAQPMDWWSEFVMRTPLLWLPHFLMGLLLAKVLVDGQSLGQSSSVNGLRRWVSWGDLAGLLLLVIEMSDHHLPARWFSDDVSREFPSFLIRHGLIAPLYYLVVLDLARGSGVVAWLLSRRFWKPLGDASFSLFMWQLPGLILFPGIAQALALSPFGQLSLVVIGTVGLALASCRWIERPLANRLRRKATAAT